MKDISNLEVLEKEELIYLAKITQQAERYDEMLEYVKMFILKMQTDLTIEERSIVSVAFKNFIGIRRKSWKVL